MEQTEISNFNQLLHLMEQNNTYLLALQEANKVYSIKCYNVLKLTPLKVAQLYEMIKRKYYRNSTDDLEGYWFENELRVFIWLLAGYCYMLKKNVQQLTQVDWKFFSEIFPNRDLIIFQFQSLSILKSYNKLIRWDPEQVEILMKIIKTKSPKRKWNEVAKQLFIESSKKYFRTGKQCRERWLNHLDPLKVHSQWTREEDEVLMSSVLKYGKKWSIIVKALGSTRTQHMVKNRFKSLYGFQARRQPGSEEAQIIQTMCMKVQNNMDIKVYKSKSRRREQNREEDREINSPLLPFSFNHFNSFSHNMNNLFKKTEINDGRLMERAENNAEFNYNRQRKDSINSQEGSKSPQMFWSFQERPSNFNLNPLYNCGQKWELQLNYEEQPVQSINGQYER